MLTLAKTMADENPILQDEPRDAPGRDGHPSPEQRAEFVLKRLEQFIRDGRTIAEGMPFKQWRDMARAEIAKAIIEAENDHQDDFIVTRRLLFTVASALVTIGFWGTLMAFDKAHYLAVAIIFTIAGLWLFAVIGEWRIRKHLKVRKARNRSRGLKKVENLTKRIRKMEIELKGEVERMEKLLKAKALFEAGKSASEIEREEAIGEAEALAQVVREKFNI